MATAKTILVTGANGQLGKELQAIAAVHPDYTFLFTDKEQLPIDNIDILRLILIRKIPLLCKRRAREDSGCCF